MTQRVRHTSYWNATAPASDFPTLAADLEADIAIVGGGLVGVTTARLLKDRGLKVALVEARRVGEEVTGKSTAKITSQHNIVYTVLERKFGEDGAAAYAEANQTGVRTIAELAARHGIACNLERKAAFTYTTQEKHVGDIEREVELARRLGLPASLTRDTGLPFGVRAAMRWDDQAQFHPVRYVKGLAATLPGAGPARDRTRQRPRASRGDGHPPAARPDRLLLRGELSAHASGDHGPGRSGEDARRHVYQRRAAAPFGARPSRR
jgi:glycine/D-amino acid oxidase-like deaminating enzyme